MIAKSIDHAGVAISALCVVHCVLLPALANALPIAGSIAENEGLHKAFVLIAIVPAALAFTSVTQSKYATSIRMLGVFGILTLLASAFIGALHDMETILTIMGALSLASAHIWRIASNQAHPHQN